MMLNFKGFLKDSIKVGTTYWREGLILGVITTVGTIILDKTSKDNN